jgi:hypothetical protein
MGIGPKNHAIVGLQASALERNAFRREASTLWKPLHTRVAEYYIQPYGMFGMLFGTDRKKKLWQP